MLGASLIPTINSTGPTASVLRWIAGVALFALFQLVWSPVGYVSTAQAQQTTITCTGAGAETATTTSTVSFDVNTNLCVIGDGIIIVGGGGSMRFTTNPTGVDRVDGVLVLPPAGPESTALSDFTVCQIPGGTNLGGGVSCGRRVDPVGAGTAIIAHTLTGQTISMSITYDGSVTDTIDIISATVTIGDPVAGPTAQDKSNTVAALQSSLNAVTPGLLNGSGIPINGNGAGTGNGVTFAPTGLGFSQSRIDTNNPLDREIGSAFTPQGYFAHRDTRQRNNGFNFSVDMNQLAAAAKRREAESSSTSSLLAYGEGGAKDGSTRPRSRFNSWVKGQYVDFDDDETNADREGDLFVVTSGLSVQMGASTTVGVLTRYRDGEVDSTALAAALDTEAYGGGAFLTTTLGGGLRVAIAALYEMGDSDITIAGATGSFDSETTTIEGRIDKRITRGAMWVEPVVSLSYIDTAQDNYTDSAGTLVAGQDLTLGRLIYGPTIGTTIQRGNTEIRPFAKLNGVWDFENDGNFAISTAGVFTSGDNALNLGGGVEIVYGSGFAIKVQGDWFTFDSDLEGWSLSGGIGAPLSAFGLGSAGTVSFDLSSNAEDATAKARVRIPLN